MNTIKFSITIPAYKSSYLEESIRSCIEQTYTNFELIVVDDCSPENLESIVSKFSDSRIRFFRNSKNCGAIDVVDNWNICLSYCTGDYVLCMGDDDRLLPNCLEKYVSIINRYPNLGVYHTRTELINANGQTIRILGERPEYETALEFLYRRWAIGCRQFIGDFLFDLKMLRDEGGYFKLPLAWASDDITAFRAAIYGGIANVNVPCFQYRENGQSITNSGFGFVKLQDKVKEEEWYRITLDKFNAVSSGEKTILQKIKAQSSCYFFKEREALTQDLLKHSLFNIIELYKKRKKLRLTSKMIFVSFLKGVKYALS